MATYSAPIEDMMFLFEKLRDNPHYNELEKYKEVNSVYLLRVFNHLFI